MSYFSQQELDSLSIIQGKPAKGPIPPDLHTLFLKLHEVVGKAIDGQPIAKENFDAKRVKQGAGKGQGYKYKNYLWIKIFRSTSKEELVFFNLTYQNYKLILSIDYKQTNKYITELYNNSQDAQNIVKKSKSIHDLSINGNNEESEIINFIISYINQNKQNLNDFYKVIMIQECNYILEKNYNLILSGAPGTGKTFLAREIAAVMIGVNNNNLSNNPQFEFVQFHPSYDYTDFVEGLRPVNNLIGNILFKRTDGIFKAFCAKAAIAEKNDANKDDKEKRKFVFVIDEINRGEISKIFGELFFSIDFGYRNINDRIPVKTQYQNLIKQNETTNTGDPYPFIDGFYVPSNVYIIGTMNDIDRSVESMDFAFRRRFTFKEILATDTQQSILSNLNSSIKDEAIKKMNALNNAISNNKQEGFGTAYNIGAAYFKRISDYYDNWDILWENHLKGVLYEYLRGIPNSDTILENWKKEYDK